MIRPYQNIVVEPMLQLYKKSLRDLLAPTQGSYLNFYLFNERWEKIDIDFIPKIIRFANEHHCHFEFKVNSNLLNGIRFTLSEYVLYQHFNKGVKDFNWGYEGEFLENLKKICKHHYLWCYTDKYPGVGLEISLHTLQIKDSWEIEEG